MMTRRPRTMMTRRLSPLARTLRAKRRILRRLSIRRPRSWIALEGLRTHQNHRPGKGPPRAAPSVPTLA